VQTCDGLNNNCNHPSWPGLGGTNEADDDGDGVSECANDCDDANAARYPGAPEVCDGMDNDCDMLLPSNELDSDLDGFRVCDGDCAPTDPDTHPGAVEVNDGLDNQCPNEPGHGVTDEISGPMTSPGAGGVDFEWPPQEGATIYQVARSTSPDFTESCVTFLEFDTTLVDPTDPPPGADYYYMVRPIFPFLGSWGQDADGVERTVSCAP
jgi:hypothetical protein